LQRIKEKVSREGDGPKLGGEKLSAARGDGLAGKEIGLRPICRVEKKRREKGKGFASAGDRTWISQAEHGGASHWTAARFVIRYRSHRT
jgi:hypothetical protein